MFNVPYLLSVLLDSYEANVNEEEIGRQVNSHAEHMAKFKLESYEENLGKFGKVFESNKVYKLRFKNLFYMSV